MPVSRNIGVLMALLTLAMALSANAGPGDGTVVVIDRPTEPDVLVQDLRVENYDATHAPVTVRIAIPESTEGPAGRMQRASVTVYLTASLGDATSTRLTEATVKLGPEWADQSVVVEVPSPGPGEYFVNIDAKIEFAGKDAIELDVSSTERVRFGTPQHCDSVEVVTVPGMSECPLSFETKNSKVFSGRFDAANTRIIDKQVEVLEELCQSGALHRVSVHGWASTLYSDNPTNEQLAQERAKSVVSVLQNRLPNCSDRIHNDSVRGTRGATKQFGEDDQSNQCAQIQIRRHTCKE
jgi:hypothetical protein